MTFRKYENLDDMFQDMRRAEEEANAHLHPSQSKIGYGDHWMRTVPEADVIVFGRIYGREEEMIGEDRESQAMMDTSYARGYRFGRAFSVICPEGELGSTHIANMIPISEDDFHIAGTLNWKIPAIHLFILLRKSGMFSI